ncbi:short chain dehydrogenase [Massariosphaeria phaeospora]|uniref:Short chain dehydrogenase n=1 Tax=Massariosphaeria phaeospora TaxID=100035 RepID=A0A7C8I6R8_9PLEO|nr:short chain dehydrogenase [Massariosphaeria phaeospora]
MGSTTLQPTNENMLKMLWTAKAKTNSRPTPPSISFAGQTVIITGGNTGLGLTCGEYMLKHQLTHLIIGSRSLERGEHAAAPLRKAFPKASIDVWALDMISYESIQAFVVKCNTLPRLDTAILNAGMTQAQWHINPSTGHEDIFQVNYLSTALLSILLLPLLKSKSPPNTPGRLLLIGSGTALSAPFTNRNADPLIPSFDDPKGWSAIAAGQRYSLSKLAGLMFLSKLADTVAAEDVIVNAVAPGMVHGTALHRDSPAGVRLVIMPILHKLLARSLEEGASTYVDAVTTKGKESHGSFLVDWEIAPFPSLMYTEEGKQTTDRLWHETVKEFEFAGARGILDSMGRRK